MQRVAGVIERGEWDAGKAVDAVSLDANDRHRRRIVLTTENGIELLLDLAQPVALRDGDGLVLADRSIVRVAGKPEPVLDVEADSATELTRIAWHLGNRHTEVQILERGLRIRADHVLADMLRGLGAQVTERDSTFEPETGAYEHSGQAHEHAHVHSHEHAHESGHSHHHHHHDNAHHHDHDHDHAHGAGRRHDHGEKL
jgi:urease accessory protein